MDSKHRETSERSVASVCVSQSRRLFCLLWWPPGRMLALLRIKRKKSAPQLH